MIKPFRVRDLLVNIHRIHGKDFTEIPPPKIPAVKKRIEEFEGSEIERERMIEDILALWYILSADKLGKKPRARFSMSDSPEKEIYILLKEKYPRVVDEIYKYLVDLYQATAEKIFGRFTDAERKIRMINCPSVIHLEHIKKVRGKEFFDVSPKFTKMDGNFRFEQNRGRYETELETLWYIVLHIGPKRRVQKSLNPESVDFLIYKSLKRKYETSHRKMVHYIKEHPELYPDES
ncbi:MAG: hypothetical protein ACE5D7_04050 [Fidelibacterota bacterium]